MSNIEKTLKYIRPNLKDVAPQTFWFSLGFGLFNLIIGLALINVKIFVTLEVVGIIPLSMWAVIFFVHGLGMLTYLVTNNWKTTRAMNIIGVAITTAWWLELVGVVIVGRSPFILYVWSLLLFLQVINCIYFMPRVDRDDK